MFGLVVMKGMTLSGHLSNINEIVAYSLYIQINILINKIIEWAIQMTVDARK